jgi:hypothetical protein
LSLESKAKPTGELSPADAGTKVVTTGGPEVALPTVAVLSMSTAAPCSTIVDPFKMAPAPTLRVPTPSSPVPSAFTSAARLSPDVLVAVIVTPLPTVTSPVA